jgi:hypothetical protein
MPKTYKKELRIYKKGICSQSKVFEACVMRVEQMRIGCLFYGTPLKAVKR